MKQLFLALTIVSFGISQINAQISLHGTISVQNSKTETGKTEYVPYAQVECDKGQSAKAQPKTSDSEGKFKLEVNGKKDMQIAISVTPKGKYQDYVIVNEDKIKDITLGRLQPVSVYICKKDELEQRQTKMVDVNMKKYRDQIRLLQKELDDLKAKYDYDNARCRILENQIDSLNKAEKDMYSLIKEFAESLTKINLDETNENYVKAYKCFANGYLDSVKYYLPDEWLEQRTKQTLRQKEEGKQQIEIGQVLTGVGQKNIEISDAELADITKSWMLKAKTAALNYQYEQAISYYEQAINIDSLNVDNIWEFAYYLNNIREYYKSEIYYQKCLEIYKAKEHEEALKTHNILTTENKIEKILLITMSALTLLLTIVLLILSFTKKSGKIKLATLFLFLIFIGFARRTIDYGNNNQQKVYLINIARVLNNLANIHKNINEQQKALEEYEEALKISRKLAKENPKTFLTDVALTLHNLAILHQQINEHQKALKENDEALKIRRKLAKENPRMYLSDLAYTLHNLGTLHTTIKEYSKALEELEKSLEIRRKLAEENPNKYLPEVAMTLNSLAVLHKDINEYPKVFEKYLESSEIFRKLAKKNPKVYLSDLAYTLNNLAFDLIEVGNNDYNQENYEEARRHYLHCLEIREELANNNPDYPNGFLYEILLNLSNINIKLKNYPATIQYLNACNDLLQKDKEQIDYKSALAQNYGNLSFCYLCIKEYAQAEQLARKALELDSMQVWIKANLSVSLLFQNRVLVTETEVIYKELSQTIYQNNETHTQMLLEGFDKLEEAGAIPKENKADMEKIKKILK